VVITYDIPAEEDLSGITYMGEGVFERFLCEVIEEAASSG
jgi:hypothetical protein